MQTWRRQTIVVGICFAVVFLARIYFKNYFVGVEGPSESGPAAESAPSQEGAAADQVSGARDTVVTLDTDP